MTDTSKGSYYTMPVDLHGCLGPDTIRNIAYRDDGGLGPEANFPLRLKNNSNPFKALDIDSWLQNSKAAYL